MGETPQTGLRSIGPTTPFKLSLATLISVLVAAAGFIWAARGQLSDLEHEQRATRSVLGDLPKRDELVKLEQRLTRALQLQLKQALLKCPRRAARGDAWMECRVVFPRSEGEEAP